MENWLLRWSPAKATKYVILHYTISLKGQAESSCAAPLHKTFRETVRFSYKMKYRWKFWKSVSAKCIGSKYFWEILCPLMYFITHIFKNKVIRVIHYNTLPLELCIFVCVNGKGCICVFERWEIGEGSWISHYYVSHKRYLSLLSLFFSN